MSSTVLLIVLAQYGNSIQPFLTQKQVCHQFGGTFALKPQLLLWRCARSLRLFCAGLNVKH